MKKICAVVLIILVTSALFCGCSTATNNEAKIINLKTNSMDEFIGTVRYAIDNKYNCVTGTIDDGDIRIHLKDIKEQTAEYLQTIKKSPKICCFSIEPNDIYRCSFLWEEADFDLSSIEHYKGQEIYFLFQDMSKEDSEDFINNLVSAKVVNEPVKNNGVFLNSINSKQVNEKTTEYILYFL